MLPRLFCLVRWRFAVVLAAALVLAACAGSQVVPGAGPARDALDAFAVEGRFTLRQADKNYSGRLSWRHVGEDNEVLLASPFGQGIAQITTHAGLARLSTADGKVYTAPDSEQLTSAVLGYPLPLAQLADWLRARGAGEVASDALGRPVRRLDADWRIDYDYDNDDAQAPPGRLVAQRSDGVELRLRIDEWTALPSASRLNEETP